MSIDTVIKLQVLLAENTMPADVARVRNWLETNGVRVTGAGPRSLTAQADIGTFRKLFGEPAKTVGGFVESLSEAQALPVPGPLRDWVKLLTLTPRHEQF